MSMLSLTKGSRRAVLTLCACIMSSGAALAQVANDFDMSTVAPAQGSNLAHRTHNQTSNLTMSLALLDSLPDQRLASLAETSRTILTYDAARDCPEPPSIASSIKLVAKPNKSMVMKA